jgi:hypothetical protein
MDEAWRLEEFGVDNLQLRSAMKQSARIDCPIWTEDEEQLTRLC